MPYIGTQFIGSLLSTVGIAANSVDGTLTKDALIADYSDVTVTAADLIVYGDATDSNNTKRDTVQGILDLAGGGGAWTFISTAVASDAASVGITGIDSTYDTYAIIIDGLRPATDGTTFWMRTSTDGGTGYDASSNNYLWQVHASSGTTDYVTSSTGDVKITLTDASKTVGNDTVSLGAFDIRLHKPSSTAFSGFVSWVGFTCETGGTPEPVPTKGASGLIKGTACLIMFEPIKALFASSFSKKGIKDAATDTSCFGDTSI